MNSSARSSFCRVETSRHDASHMHAPRGRGGWMFENEAGEVVLSHSGLYAEAKRAAVAWGKAHGVAVLYVCP